MKRVLLTVSFWLLALGFINAQEAFYIYRHDGQFHGFFYDEVIEMRQSKIGVDSIENDKWVTQEIVLADTTYRIPIAVIDSIGFQQPEIKMNPNVKFLQKEGLAPYLFVVTENSMEFMNLPDNLVPHVGEIWMGLVTDSCTQRYTGWEGSFCLVVERVSHSSDYTYVAGRPIESLSEVLEQYITVEQIGVDQQGNIIRRIAGCTPDGIPRKIINESGSTRDLTIISFDGTYNKDLEINNNVKVDFTAETTLQVKLRASYNITLLHFNVTLTTDFVSTIKPSFGLTASTSFSKDLTDFVPIPGAIIFPAACPIFETYPIPTLFVHGEGNLSARINMPKVQLGVGVDFYIDNWSVPFPVGASLHLVPGDPGEPSSDMFEFSGEVKFNGYLQSGVKFQARINSASWMKKVFEIGIGLDIYCGPRLDGEFSYNFNTPPGSENYALLSNGFIKTTPLSLGLEASAKAKIGWDDENKVKFFESNLNIGEITWRLAPKFAPSECKIASENAVITLKPEPSFVIPYNMVRLGIYDGWSDEPFETYGPWAMVNIKEDDDFYATVPLEGLKARSYTAIPIVEGPDKKPIKAESGRVEFRVPYTLRVDQESIHFPEDRSNCPSVEITTNAYGTSINTLGASGSYFDSCWVDTINYEQGKYRMTFRRSNHRLFPIPASSATDSAHAICIQVGTCPDCVLKYIGASMEGGALPKNVHASGGNASFDGQVTATRSGNQISITGTRTADLISTDGGFNWVVADTSTDDQYVLKLTQTINMTLTDDGGDWQKDHYWASGTITKKIYDPQAGEYIDDVTHTFLAVEGNASGGFSGDGVQITFDYE